MTIYFVNIYIYRPVGSTRISNALLLQEYKKQVESVMKHTQTPVWNISFGRTSPPGYYNGHIFPSSSISLPEASTIDVVFQFDNGLFKLRNVDNSKDFKDMDGNIVLAREPGEWFHPVFLNKGNVAMSYSLREALDLLEQVCI